MPLRTVQIEDFRCIHAAHLELDPQITLISGPNGSGKTSLLEAIFLLGRGRSFRTVRLANVIRRSAERFRVVGTLDHGGRSTTIGIETTRGHTHARIGGQLAGSLTELTTAFPVQIIDPGVHKLVEEGPIRRRRFMDWGVFHVEPGYLARWQRFHLALRQRNAALRRGLADEQTLNTWDHELTAAGNEVTQARRRYLESLTPHVTAAAEALLGEPIQLEYSQGWSNTLDLAVALRTARQRDQKRGTSMVGPHRADLILKTKAGLAKDSVSRGQQKLLAAALILGQLGFHSSELDFRPTLLLDDPAAELDVDRLKLLVDQVRRLPAQLVITSLRPDFDAMGQPGRLFHVEQGLVSPVL